MNQEQWDSIVADTIHQIKKLSRVKGGEYAGDEDRLANFRRNGVAIGVPMETVWRIYAGKHWDSISQFIMDLNTGRDRPRSEPMEGRVDDLIVYLILFKGMLAERAGPKVADSPKFRCVVCDSDRLRYEMAADETKCLDCGTIQPEV